jgi:vacuolar protein sorting-associated protein 8
MIIASLRYTFSHKEDQASEDDVHAQVTQQKLVKDLTAACIDACIVMDSPTFLFDDVYDVFDEYSETDVFIEILEPFILKNQITDVPPSIMKDITSHYVSRNLHQRLEQIICHINPASLDIDQINTICRRYGLYDALSYVYNNALKDYITPMIEFVSLVKDFFARHHTNGTSAPLNLQDDERASIAFEAFKVFPYLSYTLTGRIYPTGDQMSESDAYEAKQSIYYFLFSGRTITWPRDRGHLIRTTDSEESSEPTFPYLRLFLRFDAPTLFQAMDEAFEDRFLNGTESANGTTNGDSFGRAISRQFIINIFLDVMSSDRSSDIIYLYMFIARNLPKYPQFILLSGSTIEGILLHLCTYGQTEMAEEAQLAAEYLLSVFKPSDSEKMIKAYQDAKFYRLLKTTLRAEGRYTELVDVYLRDQDKYEVFECVDGLLRSGSSLHVKQRESVKNFIFQRLSEFVGVDIPRTAELFERYLPERQKDVVCQLKSDRFIVFVYLDSIISKTFSEGTAPLWIDADIREQYISLMCEFKAMELTTYLSGLAVHDIRIENVLPVLEQYNVIDAIVLLLRRAGMTKEAMHKIVIYIASLQRELAIVVGQSFDFEQADTFISEIQRYTFVGADLCEHFSKEWASKKIRDKTKGVGTLNEAEQLWLSLLESTVSVTREVTSAVTESSTKDASIHTKQENILNSLQNIVQDIFIRLLTITSSSTTPPHRQSSTISFLSILRKFLSNLGRSQLTSLRPILSTIFDAYRYEKQLITVTSKLVEADLFQTLLQAKGERERGWRASSTNCMACSRILFGPGAGGSIFAKWERRRQALEERKLNRMEREGLQSPGTTLPDGKGKGKSVDLSVPPDENKEEQDIEGDIVVFGCRHAYHRTCLVELGGNREIDGDEKGEQEGAEEGNVEEQFRCIVCDAH